MEERKANSNILEAVRDAVKGAKDKLAMIEAIRDLLHLESPESVNPVDRVRWVPIEQVQPNDYNPNHVASKELGLLYISILHDGYTQPIVTIFDKKSKKYIIVDGFHRYYVCKMQKDILERNGGMLPVVVINKNINDRMAATIRHNRARGEHSIAGMGKLVFEMLDNGWSDTEICNQLGLEPEELLKLKHITGFSALFKNVEYSKAWETKNMIRYRLQYAKRGRVDNVSKCAERNTCIKRR